MKKSKFLLIGFTLLFTIFALTLLMGGLTAIFVREVAFAEFDLPSFSIYQGETKVDQKNDEYFVFGETSSVDLHFDSLVDDTIELSILVNDNAVELNADKNAATLPVVSGVNNVTLSYTLSGVPSIKSLVISVGWTASAYEGVYYLPSENGWSTMETEGIQGFVSQGTDRLSTSSMRLITKNVEYLSFTAQWYSASSNRKQACGTISNADSSFNILGTSSSGAFVLNYAFDVVTINYKPQSSGNADTAELQIKAFSTVVESVTLTSNFDSTLGEIYYFNSRGEKTTLSQTNSVPKYLVTDFYFQPLDNGNPVKIFGYEFTSSVNENKTFDEGVDSCNVKLQIKADATLNVDFKQLLVIPQNYTEIILRKGGYTSRVSIENGGLLELDYTEKVDIALSSPALKSGERCDFYVDGEVLRANLTESNGDYIYAFGELDQDHTFTFLYSKDGNYKSVGFTYTIKLISNNTIEQDILLTDNITVANDSVNPYYYYSPASAERTSYVAGNRGKMNTTSIISFTVTESGLFTFNYFMDISEASYCLLSVGEELNIDESTDYTALIQNYGIGDAYGDYDKQSANHGNHGWRKKEIELTVTGSQTIYIYYVKVLPYDSFVDETSDTFAISGVAHYVGSAVVNTEVRFQESGNMTTSTEGISVETGSTLKVGSLLDLNATVAEGYTFYGWIINGKLASTEASYSFVLIGDTSIVAVMQRPDYYVAKDEFDFYTSLKDAVLARDVERKITLINDEAITESLTIPANIEILVPFSATDNIGFALGTTATAGPSVSWTNESKYLYLTLTVQEGVTLNVQGRFTLGAVQHYPDQSAQGHTSGAYSQIINNGTIVLSGNGYLDVMGLIKGRGRIIANENTVIRMPFLVNNYSGGTITLAYYEANNFPFYNYSLVNIQCDYTINHKAKLMGSTSLYFFGSITTQDIVIVNAVEERIDGGDGSLYWLSANSSIDFSYNAKSVNVVMGVAHIEDSGVTTLGINGEVVLGEFYLQSFGSNDMVLGLPYTLNYVINDGAKLVVPLDREYMLLPGSIMTVAENGTLDILGGFYVVEGLLQTTMAGKQYPTVDMLKNSDFAATGMLVNNGTINIVGSFAGIVQATVEGAMLQVSSNATLTKVLELGAESGSNNNKVGLTLVAKISGLRAGELSNIEQGQTYQSYSLLSGTEFVVPSFTMDYATGVEPTIAVNQAMQGSFAKLVDGKLIVYRTLSLQSETSGVKVNVNGVNYITNEKGQIEVQAEVNQAITYLSTELDKNNRSVNEWASLSVITISIPQRIEVNSESVYERVEGADGTVISDIAVSAVVHFFDGTTENIVLNAIDLTNSYVQSAEFESEAYNCSFTQTVYIQKAELTKYIEDLNTLKQCTSENLLSTAQSLYASYIAITNGLQSEQVSFVTDKISTLGGNLDSYKQIVAVLTPSNVTYGDTEVTASATTIDGKTVAVTMQNNSDYQVVNGNIQATFTYTSNFVVEGVIDIPYTVNTVYSGISQKELTVNIDNKTSVYGEALATLTSTVEGLLAGDSKEYVFSLVKAEGNNVGSYSITAEKTDNVVSSYYYLTVTTGTYTITAKQITVTVSAKNVMLSKANTTVDISEELSDDVQIEISYNILKDGEIVATAINGVVTLVGDNTIIVGDYSVEATTDNPNYSLTQTGDNLYSVVENKNYYSFDIGLNELVKEYDGEEVVIAPIVKNAETDMVIDSIVKVNGSDMQIKSAMVYNITLDVEGYTYSTVYTINPKTISVNWINTEAIYNGTAQAPKIELVGVVNSDTVPYSFDLQPINADDYNITVSIANTDYTLDETKTHAFKISPKSATLTVNQHSDMMISSLETGKIVIFTSTASENIAKDNISYEVYNASNELVFTVDANGFITVIGEVTPGEYTIKAVCSDTNFVTTSVDSTLTIVEDNNYYTIDIAFDSVTNHKEYDGNSVGVEVIVTITESGEIVDSSRIAVSLCVNGETVNEIKNAADYIVKVVIDGETEYSYTYKVNPKVLALKWNVSELVYNGQEQKPTVVAENAVKGDEISLVLGDFECVEQGEKSAFVNEIVGEASHNYTLPENRSFTYIINAKRIVVELTATNAMLGRFEQTLSISFASSELSSDEVRYIILANENEVGSVDNGVVQITTPLTVGTYSLKAVSKNHNYIITNEAVPFEVVSSEDYYTVSLGVESLSKVYDGEKVKFNVSAVVAQSGKAVDFTFTVNSNTEYQVKAAAKYNLAVNISGVSFNYVYTITKREVELEWSTNELIYNGYTQKPTCLVKNKVDGDEVEVSLAVGESISAGEKQIIANSLVGADSTNYSITEQAYKYTIKPMALTITVSDTFSYYGSADSEIALTVKEALPSVDTLKSIVSATREEGSTAGEYAITVSCISSNYTIIANAAIYTVKPKPITIMIDGKTSIYGEALLPLTATTNDQAAYDDQISELYTLEKQDGLQKGEYVISGKCVNTNYDITFINSVYTITAREIEFSISDFEMVYGEETVEIIPTIPDSYSYAYEDSFGDIITVSREQGNGVGSYKITAIPCGNDNYKINRISYTYADSSTYTIKARPITLTLNDKTADNAYNYEEVVELITNNGYSIEGSIVDGDQIDIEIVVIFSNGNVTMTADNFDAYFIAGRHTISMIASCPNYEITVVDATLTVTKPKLDVVNMITEYTYNDGEPITVFDWTKNIDGNLKGADENSFGVEITDMYGNLVEQIVNAGTYNVKVVIIHQYAFEFKDDAVTDYIVTVNKKDISDQIVAVGLPENGVAEYDPYANSIYAECALEGVMVDYEITPEDSDIGTFSLVATIDDSNYFGTKTFTWQIVKIDLSELFACDGFTDNGVYVLGDSLDIKLELPKKYKNLEVSYTLTNEAVEVQTISTAGEYIVKPKVSDTVHYKFDVSFRINVIANYDEIFTSIQRKLAGIDSSDIWATVDEIREELKGIAIADRENVKKVDRYNEVLEQAEELVSGLLEELEEVANTARCGQNAQKAMEILNVITIFAYFGIKQTF